MLNGEFTRDLDRSEVYYELIDRTWSMNAVGAAELEESFPTSRVEEAWNELAAQIPIVGARVERASGHEAHLVFGTPHGSLAVGEHVDVASAWAAEARSAFEMATGPLVRCSVVQRDSGTTLVIAAHHSALDGKYVIELLTLLATALTTSSSDIGDHELTEPTVGLHEAGGGPPAGRPRLADQVATAREMRNEDGYVANAGPFTWYDDSIDPPRDPGFAFFELSEAETSGLIGWARSQQATVHGALSAAMVNAAVSLSPELERVGLSASVDLRSRFGSPDRGCIGLAAGVLSGSYDSTVDSGELARVVSADTRRRFDRGEGELLYALSGVGRLPVDDNADKVIRQWTEQATPTIFQGNLGMVSVSAPPALRQFAVGMAPIPNQVAVVVASTFRRRLSLTVGYDRNRFSIDPEGFAATLHEHVLALARAGERSAALR